FVPRPPPTSPPFPYTTLFRSVVARQRREEPIHQQRLAPTDAAPKVDASRRRSRPVQRASDAAPPSYRRRAGPHEIGVQPLEGRRSEEHTSELQSRENLVCRLL